MPSPPDPHILTNEEVRHWQERTTYTDYDVEANRERRMACQECGQLMPANRLIRGGLDICSRCNKVWLIGPVEIGLARMRGHAVRER